MPSKKDKLNISLSPNMNACVINNYLPLFDFFLQELEKTSRAFDSRTRVSILSLLSVDRQAENKIHRINIVPKHSKLTVENKWEKKGES